MRPLLSILVLLSPFVASQAEKSITDSEESFSPSIDPLFFQQNFSAIINSSAIHHQVSTSLAACQSTAYLSQYLDPLHAVADDTKKAKQRVACERALFTQHLLNTREELIAYRKANGLKPNPAGQPSRALLNVLEASWSQEETGFQRFFMDYELQGKATILQTAFNVGGEESLWNDCLRSASFSKASSFSLTELCPNLTPHLQIPALLVNDYFQRLNLTRAGANGSPKVIHLSKEGEATGLLSCPLSSHTLLVNLGKDLAVSSLGANETRFLLLRSGGDRETEELSELFSGLARESLVDSPPSLFSLSAKDMRSFPWLSQATMLEGRLTTGDFLFVPAGGSFSLRLGGSGTESGAPSNEDNSSEGSQDRSSSDTSSDSPSASLTGPKVQEGLALQFCYADASNMAEVRRSLRVKCLVDASLCPLLLALEASRFDSFMSRKPEPTSWDQFVEGEKENKEKAVSKTGRRGKFKDWQEDNRWKYLIRQLTLPAPLSPTITAVGRRNVTLQWKNIIPKQPGEASSHAYRFYASSEGPEKLLLSDRVPIADVQEDKLKWNHLSSSLDEGEELVEFTLDGLQPDSPYTFALAGLYDGREGMLSGPTELVWTLPVAPPSSPLNLQVTGISAHSVSLLWDPPVDDGGLLLKGYVVERKQLKAQEAGYMHHGVEFDFSYSARTQGSATSFSMQNLLPSSSYEFRVLAVNEQFEGEPSLSTGRVTTANETAENEVAHVAGAGHASFSRHLDADSGRRRLQEDSTVIGPVATLSDMKQQLKLPFFLSTQPLDAWAAHFSPGLFDVTAVKLLILGYADFSLCGVAYKQFGLQVPLVTKVKHVQAAGGLGVVIMDNGKCKRGFDQHCCPGSDKKNGDYFASLDPPRVWEGLRIPVILVSKESGALLKNVMSSNWRELLKGAGEGVSEDGTTDTRKEEL